MNPDRVFNCLFAGCGLMRDTRTKEREMKKFACSLNEFEPDE